MDVGALLLDALQRRGWSLAELARRAGTSRGALWRYASGAASPSVRTLTRILAAAEVQIRAELEPLLADVDARVDALLAGSAHIDAEEVARLVNAAAEEQTWGFEDPVTGAIGRRSGRITWALDGATALNVHGLACPSEALALVLLFDDPARSWLTKGMMRGTAPGEVVGWWTATLQEARASLSELAIGRYGLLRIRIVELMPPVLHVRLPGSDHVAAVVSVDEVERTQPHWGEVLARLRSRRDAAKRSEGPG